MHSDLEQRIAELEKRVAELEKTITGTVAKVEPPYPNLNNDISDLYRMGRAGEVLKALKDYAASNHPDRGGDGSVFAKAWEQYEWAQKRFEELAAADSKWRAKREQLRQKRSQAAKRMWAERRAKQNDQAQATQIQSR